MKNKNEKYLDNIKYEKLGFVGLWENTFGLYFAFILDVFQMTQQKYVVIM